MDLLIECFVYYVEKFLGNCYKQICVIVLLYGELAEIKIKCRRILDGLSSWGYNVIYRISETYAQPQS